MYPASIVAATAAASMIVSIAGFSSNPARGQKEVSQGSMFVRIVRVVSYL